MADNMMRIAGRGDDGLAKPISTDNRGNINVQLTNSKVENNRLAYRVSEPIKLTIPTYDGSGQGVHPSVLRRPEGFGGYEYWMAFTPFTNADPTTENPSILASHDGVSWEVPAGLTNPIVPAPVDPIRYFNRDPELIYDPDNNQLIMYWVYTDRQDTGSRLLRKTSADGVTWSANVECAFNRGNDASNFINAFGLVKRHDNSWVGWESNSSNVEGAIQKIESPDGINWYRRAELCPTNHFGRSWHLSVFPDGDGYHFLSASQPISSERPNNHTILYYGFSPDGENIEFDTAPLLMPDSGWLSGKIYRSSMIQISGQKYRVYISAYDQDNNIWSLGYFDMLLTGLGRNVPQIGMRNNDRITFPLIKGLQIRDTLLHFLNYGQDVNTALASLKNWNKYKHRRIMIHNTHNQTLNLALYAQMRGTARDKLVYGATATPKNQEVNLPIGNQYHPIVVSSVDIQALDDLLPDDISVGLKANTAPDTGSLDIYISMWN